MWFSRIDEFTRQGYIRNSIQKEGFFIIFLQLSLLPDQAQSGCMTVAKSGWLLHLQIEEYLCFSLNMKNAPIHVY